MTRREMLPGDYVYELGAQALRWGEVEADTVPAEQAVADLQSLVGPLSRKRLALVTAGLALLLGRVTSELAQGLEMDSAKVLESRLVDLFGDRPDGAS